MKDYYSILGVKRNATFYDITKAYRELSAQYSEANKGDEPQSGSFADIQEAYEILSNDLKRREYDQNMLPPEQETKNFNKYSREAKISKEEEKTAKEEEILKEEKTSKEGSIIRDRKFSKVDRVSKVEEKTLDERNAIEESVSENIIINNAAPTIEMFKSNKLEFNYDEDVTFRWKTNNADKVTLLPFGLVSPTEQKSYKINDFKNKYITFELIAENTSIGKKAVASVTLKNNLYDELFNFFKSELEKQYRNTTPIQTPPIPVNQTQRIPERPLHATPKKEYQPIIPDYQPRTTVKKPTPPKEKKESSSVIHIIFKVLLYLFFLVSLIALIYLGFFLN